MSDAWDPSLYDPTTRPADGLLLKAIGGRTGTLALENGQKLRFPWKAQQQVSGSAPPRVQSYEIDFGGQHTLGFQLAGAVMNTNSPTIDMQSPFPDDSGEPTLYINSGARVGSSSANILLTGDATTPTVAITGVLTLYDSLATDDITNRVGAMTIDSSSSLTLRSGNTMTLQPDANVNAQVVTTGTGDILLDSADGLTIDGSTLVSILGGDIDLTSGDDITITAGDLLTLAAGGNVNIDPTGTVLIQTTGGNITMGTGSSSITIGNTSSTVTIAGVNINAWQSYTPQVRQNGNRTSTVTRAVYTRLGRTIIFEIYVVVTATGSASNVIDVSLPVTAEGNTNVVGSWYFYDSGGGVNRTCVAALNSTTTVSGVMDNSTNYFGASVYTKALASGDAILVKGAYAAAT